MLLSDITESVFFHMIEAPTVKKIIDLGKPRELKHNEILFHEGDTAKHCFLILDGHLKLVKQSVDGAETLLRYVSPNQVTAAISLIREHRYPATASVVDSVRLVEWDKTTLRNVFFAHPQLAINIIETMSDRLNELQERYQELSSERVESRIAKALLRITEQAGRKTAKGIVAELTMSRQDLANYAGTTQFTVSRTLSKWQKEGWVLAERELVTVLSVDSLSQIARQT